MMQSIVDYYNLQQLKRRTCEILGRLTISGCFGSKYVKLLVLARTIANRINGLVIYLVQQIMVDVLVEIKAQDGWSLNEQV